MDLKKKLLSPLSTSAFTLSNRVVMAPMSRRRATYGVPGATAPIYYGQRAGAGLIITENTAITPNGIGYLHTPGIYNDAQVFAWKQVTDEVHARGGKIVMQLVHAGRIGHPLNHEDGSALVAPSPVRANLSARIEGNTYLPMPQPQELDAKGLQAMTDAHIQAAKRAMQAGFDGVEIHAAHGFLPEQFLHPHTNLRTDQYGGNIARRSRFLLEIMEGVSAAIGKDRTGIRLSPFAALNDLSVYREEAETHQYLADALQQMNILYVHLSDQGTNGSPAIPEDFIRDLRKRFHNLMILAGGFSAVSAEASLRAGLADLIAFGRPFIANPDLVERFRYSLPLSAGDQATYYEGGDEGYIDYPAMYKKDSAGGAGF